MVTPRRIVNNYQYIKKMLNIVINTLFIYTSFMESIQEEKSNTFSLLTVFTRADLDIDIAVC